ncbi:EI24, partial [Cervus elaphus hippelaphus]
MSDQVNTRLKALKARVTLRGPCTLGGKEKADRVKPFRGTLPGESKTPSGESVPSQNWMLEISKREKQLRRRASVSWLSSGSRGTQLTLHLSYRRGGLPGSLALLTRSSTSCLRPSSSCRNQNAPVAVRHRKELACHSGLVCPAFLTRQSSRLVSGSSSLSSFLDSSSLKKRPGKAQLLQMCLFSLVFLNNSLFHKTVSL